MHSSIFIFSIYWRLNALAPAKQLLLDMYHFIDIGKKASGFKVR